ncbi:MAG: DsbC family protein [Motiliproteus sp.]|nr:DsbC family protein [Motiliproteus sp.]MCW9052403.1 DsbC family protein [Motiliproteus sp.]
MKFPALVLSIVSLSTAILMPNLSYGAENYQQLRSKIASVIGRVNITEIKETDIPNLLEVEFSNGQAIYASTDGNYILDGTLYQLRDDRAVNIRKERLEAKLVPLRQQSIAELKVEDMVIFSPKGDVKATIYAFTDVDCGYCRKLHNEIQAYNDLGIEVRYLAYPRAGVGSHSYDKMVAIWCADDPLEAMTASKAGRPIPMKTCDNPVSDQFALGGRLGVTGTPSLITSDGHIMPGYIPAPRLAAALQVQ